MVGPGRRRGGYGKKRKSPRPKTKCPYEPHERILCYEPDPTKYRVLYDAKVVPTSTKA
jgi:hypothetical protein